MIEYALLGGVYALILVKGVPAIVGRLPDRVRRPLSALKRAYLAPFRWLTPDRVYRLYYETGLMDAESYRWFQEQGYIRDDLDPTYIQRTHTPEDSETGGEQA